jgi:hypothetical protein
MESLSRIYRLKAFHAAVSAVLYDRLFAIISPNGMFNVYDSIGGASD